MKKITSILVCFVFLLIVSCNKSKDEVPDSGTGPGAGNGILKGTVYSPNGQVPLPSITIEAVVDGVKKAATSDKEGKFTLELPAGEHEVKMYAGAGERFSLQKKFKVEAGKTTTVPAADARLSYTGKIAYMKGSFDAIQSLVMEMGIQAKELSREEVSNYEILKQYDVLLLNCGASFIDFEEEHVLDRFLKDGRTVYASDWELRALSKQDWGFIPEELLAYNDMGEDGIIEGKVTFEPFKNALGKDKITIEFDMPRHMQIEHYATNDNRFKLLATHPQKGPLALSIQWGPTRTSSKGVPYGGNIIYTTFHDAALSNDVKVVLQQMILQL
ncbi:MAG TPA: carboxypeptidase-like regulatory domain-containing protein [Flavisolibacter sp.]|nr:carboxypeptidase-like regulatory domain-containing protein [Flavisolibacter sp.]